MEKSLICKVWNTRIGAKLITVPRKSYIKKGDYVMITKMDVTKSNEYGDSEPAFKAENRLE